MARKGSRTRRACVNRVKELRNLNGRPMLIWIAFISLIAAFALLVWLSIIDLRIRLLPNEIVLAFATSGLIFHLTTMAGFVSVENMLVGGVSGFGVLYIMRVIANRIYEQDALGLGDVKLMGAGGLWLGLDGIMLAMAAGAGASLLHGLVYGLYDAKKHDRKPDFSNLKIPAGPGFAAGIVFAGIIEFNDFPRLLLSQL